jgi:putative hydrolase of the HAD superfamily
MLKNVVFDLGNVLLGFRPAEYLKKLDFTETYRLSVLSDIFASPEWQLLDDGALTISEAVESIILKTSLTRDEIMHMFDLRLKMLHPLERNIKLLPELKNQGFRLYYLSNFPGDIFPQVRKQYQFFSYFDGGIISAEVKCSKPGTRIYKILLDKYSLNAEECLYIDDLEPNVITSETIGMTGFYTAGSPEISEEVCRRLKINCSPEVL